jgi:hypothetical protein
MALHITNGHKSRFLITIHNLITSETHNMISHCGNKHDTKKSDTAFSAKHVCYGL